jgi:hypothetical protein
MERWVKGLLGGDRGGSNPGAGASGVMWLEPGGGIHHANPHAHRRRRIGTNEGVVDNRPWGYELLKKRCAKGLKDGIDLVEELTVGCLRWTGGDVLEHVGFQGTKSALDVFEGVSSDNMGMTMIPEVRSFYSSFLNVVNVL